MLRAATVEVGSDRDHHAHASIRVGRRIDQRVDERGSLELVGARGEDLFELVDDDHTSVPTHLVPKRTPRRAGIGGRRGVTDQGLVERAPGVFSRAYQDHGPLVATRQHAVPEGRDQPGAHRRGLPAPRRTDDAEERGPCETRNQLRDQTLASEEQVRIVDVEGREPLEG